MAVLSNSFIHVAGIGECREREIWEHGTRSWREFLAGGGPLWLSADSRERICREVRESADALECSDGAFFEERMPSREMWRLYPEFKDSAVFLDIETTGLSPGWDEITVISLFDGKEPRALVQGKDLEEFPEIIKRYSLIVTYNGQCFDLPFLHSSFRKFRRSYAHFDLRWALQRLGLTGGLKGVEKKVGIEREGALAEVDGFMAVSLWHEWKTGNRAALDTLLRYALEDVVNLRYLAELTYNENVKSLPIKVPTLKHEPAPRVDIPFDANLIRRLAREVCH
jgi:uncharacterized protein YprB with RNaseH-like and TPR domain